MKTPINWKGTPVVVEHNGVDPLDVRDEDGKLVSIDMSEWEQLMDKVKAKEE